MKELSIKEKAKRYDKVVARAKEQLDYAKAFDYDNEQVAHDIRITVYDIFPELKESEDEQIKKRIIQSLHGDVLDIEETNKAIAWLERQSEQIDIANKEYWRGYREGKQEILDKYAELEKQGEQKSIDAVEPRFHEGDFIKHNKANLICKVISVNSGSYCVQIPLSCGCFQIPSWLPSFLHRISFITAQSKFVWAEITLISFLTSTPTTLSGSSLFIPRKITG